MSLTFLRTGFVATIEMIAIAFGLEHIGLGPGYATAVAFAFVGILTIALLISNGCKNENEYYLEKARIEKGIK